MMTRRGTQVKSAGCFWPCALAYDEMKGMNMQGKIVGWTVKGASMLTASALGMALTVVPAVAATDTNLSGFNAADVESQSYGLSSDGRFGNKDQAKTIGNQKMVANVEVSKDTMPDNPSQQLPDKVSAAVPDDATVISKDLAATKDGQVKNLETGEVVTDPKLVGTEDTPPDPLEVTGGKRFIPVDASDVKEAVQRNGGDANAAADAGAAADSAATPSKATAKGSVHTAALQNNQYGAYWGSYNNTQAFFERGGNLFVQQAKGVVDVSEHQGGIDWQTAKNSGVEGAIIRIGFGWGNRLDYQAARNISECKRLGIPFGVYLYSYAYDNNSARAEGNDVVNKLRQLGVNPGDLTFPVYYDLERWSWTGHTPPTNPWVYDGMVNTWYGCLQNNGYNNLSVYSYTSYLNTALNTGNIRAKTRWVASYGARTGFGFSSNDRAWQYADNGRVNGINGNVDLNAFGNYNYSDSDVGNSAVLQIGNYRAVTLPNGKYFISSAANDSSGIDIAGASDANNLPLQIWSANRTVAQQYRLTQQSDGSYEIRSIVSNKVFDVPGANPSSGAIVEQNEANGSKAQRWFLRDAGKGAMYIQSALGNWVLGLKDFNTFNGTKLQLMTPTLNKSEQFIFSTVSNVPQGHLRISSVLNDNVVFDIPGGAKYNYAALSLYSWNFTDAQKFDFQEIGNAIYQISNIRSGKVIDLPGANTSNGTRLQQFDANGTCSQHWAIRESVSGQYSFYSSCAADSAMDVPGGQATNSQYVQLFQGNSTDAQRWGISQVRSTREEYDDFAKDNQKTLLDGTYTMAANNNSNMVLEVAGGSLENSARVQLYAANGTEAQLWRVTHDSTGYVILMNVRSGKVLDVAGGQDSSGVSMQQYSFNGSYAQKWIAVKKNGSVKIVSALNSSLVLDVDGARMSNGATVQTYTDNGTGAQRWSPSSR
jgi:GH25 family lysozyme M1 (1,4-beta-N-acetylmuramidase)